MARKKLIAGNWKMNGLLADGVDLAKGIAAEVKALGKPQCEFLVCPPFTLLTSVKKPFAVQKWPWGRRTAILRRKAPTPATSARQCWLIWDALMLFSATRNVVPTTTSRMNWLIKSCCGSLCRPQNRNLHRRNAGTARSRQSHRSLQRADFRLGSRRFYVFGYRYCI